MYDNVWSVAKTILVTQLEVADATAASVRVQTNVATAQILEKRKQIANCRTQMCVMLTNQRQYNLHYLYERMLRPMLERPFLHPIYLQDLAKSMHLFQFALVGDGCAVCGGGSGSGD